MGHLQLLLRVHLGGDAGARVLLGQRVALDDAVKLHLGSAVHHHDAVVIAVKTGLDQQRGVRDGDTALPGIGEKLDQVRLILADERVQDRFEDGALLGVREDDAAKTGAVDGALRGQDLLAERLGHGLVRRRAYFDETVSDLVGVEDGGAQGGEDARDGRLARGDSTGQTDPQDERLAAPGHGRRRRPERQRGPGRKVGVLGHRATGRRRRRAARRVLRSRQAMVSGPTPPGTGVSQAARSAASRGWTSPTSV